MEFLVITIIFIVFFFACLQVAWGMIKFTWKHAILLSTFFVLILFLLDI
jgi:hypothetical protein